MVRVSVRITRKAKKQIKKVDRLLVAIKIRDTAGRISIRLM